MGFFMGVCGYCCLAATDCTPCGLAVLRGGIRFIDGSNGPVLGDVQDHRLRFGIPGDTFCTFCGDCCLHSYCGVCAGVQEYRQITTAIDRGFQMPGPQELRQAAQVVVGTLVGEPVSVK